MATTASCSAQVLSLVDRNDFERAVLRHDAEAPKRRTAQPGARFLDDAEVAAVPDGPLDLGPELLLVLEQRAPVSCDGSCAESVAGSREAARGGCAAGRRGALPHPSSQGQA